MKTILLATLLLATPLAAQDTMMRVDAPPQTTAASRSHSGVGAVVGLVVGAGATYALLNTGGSTAPCDRERNQDAMSSGECAGLYALGGLAGAGLGALIGRFVRTEQRVSESVRLDVAPAPAGGMSVGVTLRPRW
jgi:hypothetical protein